MYSCAAMSAYHYGLKNQASNDNVNVTMTNCLDCREIPWENRMIGVWKLTRSTAFKWNEHQTQCLKSASPHVGIPFPLARYTAFYMVGQRKSILHFRRAEDLLQWIIWVYHFRRLHPPWPELWFLPNIRLLFCRSHITIILEWSAWRP